MSRGRDQNQGRTQKSRQRSDRQGNPNSQRRHARQRSDDRVRAQELVEKSGLPWNLALQVARNQVELNVVLERLARRDKVEMLVRRHGLERSMAHQVVLGNQTLDEILSRNRMKTHISENHERSVLRDHLDSGAALSLALHGLQEVTGTISSIDQYEFTFVPLEAEARKIHKLQAKFAFDPGDTKVIRNNVQRDPSAETS
ncbi:MAG: hypothetical protein QGG40_09035, partial [Myxococcota bacterium]|nr:hypothetical protein [Myxococcota bacterium]